MAITTAISDLFSSIYELFASIIGTIYTIIASFVSAIVNFVSGIFTLSGDVVQGVVDVVGGVGKFILGTYADVRDCNSYTYISLGNIVLISVGALLAFGFFRYTAQGRQVAAGKKTA